MFNNFWNESLVLLFCVLFIEDAILFISEADAADEVFASESRLHAVIEVREIIITMRTKKRMKNISADSHALVELLGAISEADYIIRIITHIELRAVFYIFARRRVEAVLSIGAVK